ncbi:Gustatory and odorant receptor 24 [Zootermopsis nevadensis]|uniref:Gustatory and odorant receptor 24 n=1 Tax=Zootermopsis nevadensis TaxID=136037 RepID=A0A067QJK1_ZOONE|nr:Gustatory and odorant receptor 24 [Zootermopsis nevadensis]
MVLSQENPYEQCDKSKRPRVDVIVLRVALKPRGNEHRTVLQERMMSLHDRRNFDYKLYNVLHVSICGTCVIIPLLMALDLKKLVLYTGEWMQYQILFRKVTGQLLVLSVRRRCICYAVLSCLGGTSTIFFYFYEPRVPLLALPSYMFSGILAEIMSKLKQRTVSAELIGEYRILWMRLRELVSGAGVATETTLALYVIFLLFGQVMCLYGLLFGISDGHSSRNVTMTVCGVVGLLFVAHFYCVCRKADYIMTTVEIKVQKELHHITTWCRRQDIQQESKLKQRTVSAELIGEYRILWMRLRELVSGAGVATETTLALYVIFLLFGQVMCLYGLLFGISDGHSSRNVTMTVCGVVGLLFVAHFYCVCRKADYIMTTVSRNKSSEGVTSYHNMVQKAGHTAGGQYMHGVRIIEGCWKVVQKFNDSKHFR